MNNVEKNILIVFLIIVIVVLAWMLYAQSYGRYCIPIVKDLPYHQNS